MNWASSALGHAERFDRRIPGKRLQSETAKTLDSKRVASPRKALLESEPVASKRNLRKVAHSPNGSNQPILHVRRKNFEISAFEVDEGLEAFAGLKGRPE